MEKITIAMITGWIIAIAILDIIERRIK